MTNQTNIFYAKPDLIANTAEIIAIKEHPRGFAIAVSQNIIRASGGGEPRDMGKINNFEILDVTKSLGMTWLVIDTKAYGLQTGEKVNVSIDSVHRDARRRLHTATHILIRSAYNYFDGFDVKTAEIADDASSALLIGKAVRPINENDISVVDRMMRSEVLNTRTVKSAKVKSVDDAQKKYANLFRVSARHGFRGRIRVVEIDGFDANPCSGLHHPTTDIGPYEIEPLISRNQSEGIFGVRIRLTRVWMYWFS